MEDNELLSSAVRIKKNYSELELDGFWKEEQFIWV